MGVSVNIACVTCKKDYWCGYGSYSTANERAKKVNLLEHKGHELVHYNEDYHYERDGDLFESYPLDWKEKLVIKGFKDFETVDLQDTTIIYRSYGGTNKL